MPCLDSIAHKPLQPDMHDYLRGSNAPCLPKFTHAIRRDKAAQKALHVSHAGSGEPSLLSDRLLVA